MHIPAGTDHLMSEKKVLIMQLCVCEVFFVELKQLVDQLATILIIILVVF